MFIKVDWYPWGEEAFDKARSEMKPIFLSVGYSTCHWCHVMERESFEDKQTAKLLNENFVSIKVDKEERPDVDRIYMSYLQATTGHGGWPMSVFLTPNLKPFFGGTYFPSEDRYGMPSFKTMLKNITSAWRKKQQAVIDQSEETMEQLAKYLVDRPTERPKSGLEESINLFIDKCAESLTDSFDRVYGGFGGPPKFPRPSEIYVLLSKATRSEEGRDRILEMAKWTMDKMSMGGIYDHVGGGFHRYSVDELWHVPHFEKMLYDNAQISLIYLHMYQLTKGSKWASVACGILDYIRREITDPLGGIYSAEDADSLDAETNQKKEGAFYVWRAEELKTILDEQEYSVFAAYYNVKDEGNCNISPRSDLHKEFVGKNCLIALKTDQEIAEHLGLDSVDKLKEVLSVSRRKVYERRKTRQKPHLDNKVVASWNGMSICAFAQASRILGQSSVLEAFPVDGCHPHLYLDVAKKIGRFVLDCLWNNEDQLLKRSYCSGVASIDAFADDYAWVISGFLDLYEASGEIEWLKRAVHLQDRMNDKFFDAENGGYFSTGVEDPSILLRLKEEYDSAEPAASSIALSNLVRISALLSSKAEDLMDKAQLTIQYFASRLSKMPQALPQMAHSMHIYDEYVNCKKVVIFGRPQDERTVALIEAVHMDYNVTKAVLLVDPTDTDGLRFWKENSIENLRVLNKVMDWGEDNVEPRVIEEIEPTAYVCLNFTCKAPTRDPDVVRQQLEGKSKPVIVDFDITNPGM